MMIRSSVSEGQRPWIYAIYCAALLGLVLAFTRGNSGEGFVFYLVLTGNLVVRARRPRPIASPPAA